MQIKDTLLNEYASTLQNLDDLDAVETFVDTLPEAYRDELDEEISDRRAELDESPTLDTATTAELIDHLKSDDGRRETVLNAFVDEETDEVSGEEGEDGPSDEPEEDTDVEKDNTESDTDEPGDENDDTEDAKVEDYEDASYSVGDRVKWSWQGSTVHGRVAEVGDQFTVDGNEITGDEDEAVYKLDQWDDEAGEFKDGNVAKPESSLSMSDKEMEDAEDTAGADGFEIADEVEIDKQILTDADSFRAVNNALRDAAERLGCDVGDDDGLQALATKINEASSDADISASDFTDMGDSASEAPTARDQLRRLTGLSI